MEEVIMRLEEAPPPVRFASFSTKVANDNAVPTGVRLKYIGATAAYIVGGLGLLYLIVWLVSA
ncbi:MAG: hypothetical protein LBJ70_01815 [Holosporales bacterium]|jgi:hypothetical protein|nr:hypothetical protein [Holosporales bacterium]